MSITDILGGNILGGVKGIISQFVASPEDKLKAEAAAQALVAQQQAAIEASYQAEIEAKKAVMVAELNQGDTYTKRARPTIIYVGLGAMLINYVACPWLAYFTHGAATPPPIAIPGDFWTVWGGVCGAYVIGRTVEKAGMTLPFCKPNQ